MTKTTQLGLRIENSLLERIEFLAENEGIDRNMWIKRALASFVDEEEQGMSEQAVEDYINLTIDDKELLTFIDRIPQDIKQAREMKLKQITKK